MGYVAKMNPTLGRHFFVIVVSELIYLRFRHFRAPSRKESLREFTADEMLEGDKLYERWNNH